MKSFRYLPDVTTLQLNADLCVGCGMCERVCPHGVIQVIEKTARIMDRDACIECGACATNCPVQAIDVTPGVGCAAYIIQTWIRGREAASCGGASCC
ncbi:MAG: mercury methylation ferredoxin HgcB [Desulfatirhabdiaceae bacterium]